MNSLDARLDELRTQLNEIKVEYDVLYEEYSRLATYRQAGFVHHPDMLPDNVVPFRRTH